MSPDRITRGYVSASSNGSSTKPYARTASNGGHTNTLTLHSPSAAAASSLGGNLPHLHGSTGSSPPSQPNPERPGFPTYAQYKQIETGYIESLTPRRQGKALISQSMFDRIWDVLHHPESQLETAQFRFWARKMFTINKNYRITLGVAEGQEAPPQEVLLHDNLLVAIQEQLYDLLCYCHGSTGHGGRDKTCALIRKHYTWVPKDLVSNFIKACPTCIMKKCGNMDVGATVQSAQHAAQMAGLISEADKAAAAARLIASSVGGGAGVMHQLHQQVSPLHHHRAHLQRHRPLPQDEVFFGGALNSATSHHRHHRQRHQHDGGSSSNSSSSSGRPSRRRLATVPVEGGPLDIVDSFNSGGAFGIGIGSIASPLTDQGHSNQNHGSIYMKMSASVLGASSTNTTGAGANGSGVTGLSSLSSSLNSSAALQETLSNSSIEVGLPWASLLGGTSSHAHSSHSHFQHQSQSNSNPFQQHHHHPGLTLAPLMALKTNSAHEAMLDSSSSSSGSSSSNNHSHGGGNGNGSLMHSASPHLASPSHNSGNGGLYASYHQPIPMVREVSLYKGLPNGWQYRHDDFESAHAEFIDSKRQWDNGSSHGSSHSSSSHTHDVSVETDFHRMGVISNQRIPDIAGLWGPDQFRELPGDTSSSGSMEEVDIALLASQGAYEQSPRHTQRGYEQASSNGYPMPPPMMRHLDLSDFQDEGVHHSHHSLGSYDSIDAQRGHSESAYHTPQIDPALLSLTSPTIQAGGRFHGEVSVEDEYEEYDSAADNGSTSEIPASLLQLDAGGGDSGGDSPMRHPEDEGRDAEQLGDVGMLSTSSTVTSLSQRRGYNSQALHIDLSHIIDQTQAELNRSLSGREPSSFVPRISPPSLAPEPEFFSHGPTSPQPVAISASSPLPSVSPASSLSSSADSGMTHLSLSNNESRGSATTTLAGTPMDEQVKPEQQSQTLAQSGTGDFLLKDADTETGTAAGDEVVKDFIQGLVAESNASEANGGDGEGASGEIDSGMMEEADMAEAQAVSAF